VGAAAPAPVAEGKGAPGAAPEEKTAVVVPSAPSGDETEWLTILNNYRAMAGLPAEREDPALSNGAFAHARYLVKNGGTLRTAMAKGVEIHNEESGNPYFRPEGQRAARAGDIEQWWGPLPTSRPPPGWAVDQWVASTWHRLEILNPRLHGVGYGEFCERGQCAAVLDVLSGLGKGALTPASAPAPIQFPPQGAVVHINALGGEWPNPLSSCYGYTFPAGLPITMQLGTMVPARLSAYSLRRESASQILEACGFDAQSYSNPNAAEQDRGREALTDLGAVVAVPRTPLAAGNYTVEMTVNGRSYTWRFLVEKDAG